MFSVTCLIRFFLFGGFFALHFGGKSSSSQASTTTNQTITETTDRRTVADGGAVVIGDGSSPVINMMDANAINKAAELGQAAIVAATQAATTAAKSSDKALGQLAGAYESANVQAQAVASGNKTLAIVGMAVAGILAAAMLSKRGKAA